MHKAVENHDALVDEHEAVRKELELALQGRSELEQSVKALEGSKNALEEKLAKLKNTKNDAEVKHKELLNALQSELEQANTAIKEHQEALNQVQDERNKFEESQGELESLLEQEQQKTKFLQRSLETAEDAVEISDTANEEMQQEVDKLSQQLAEQKVTLDTEQNSKAELQHKYQKIVQDFEEEVGKLKHELNQTLEERLKKEKDLQSEQARLQAVKSDLEKQLVQLQEELQSQTQAFEASTAVQKARIDQLEGELAAATKEIEKFAQSQEELEVPQSAQQEILRLNKVIEGLREVQLEMEDQLSNSSEEELSRLRIALENEKKLRLNAESLAKQTEFLRRERDVQESAVEMLGDDLEQLAQQNTQLVGENEALNQQLSVLQDQINTLTGENHQLLADHEKATQKQDDSKLIDDLLWQLEDWQSKADVYQNERNDARADLDKLNQEIKRLLSGMEDYLRKARHEGAAVSDDELEAVRDELELMRIQAAEELEKMRRKAASVERISKGGSGARDADTVASIQALRQEVDTAQLALSEKDLLLHNSQAQCRILEDAIEDRDKEIDQLKHKLEIIVRNHDGVEELSEILDSAVFTGSHRQIGDSALAIQEAIEGSTRITKSNDEGGRRATLGRFFRKR
jgi:chromosome segregation ATPase